MEAIAELARRGWRVTAYVSRAGEELLRSYGLLEALASSCTGPYPAGIVFERDEPWSFPSAARVYKGVYRAVVISPATTNAVSKIVHGIADDLVSNLASHALKSGTKLLVVPTDLKPIESLIPVLVRRELCEQCDSCAAAPACPTGALRPDPLWKVRVNAALCTMCGACVPLCPAGAIEVGARVVVRPHPHHARIVSALREIEGVSVLEDPGKVLELLEAMER